ncbi:scp-like extracellular [Colletotrichum kahawae]|uniref:Scp-like extracellular n=1 Tax=Colletotrichum kahawae TaxID=34407 RepID=A0AAE0CXG3_COLKA|nr:scp-like extracellular [Colletotrichum kahawae]
MRFSTSATLAAALLAASVTAQVPAVDVQSLLPAAGTPAIFDKTTIIRSTSILTTTVRLANSTGLANSTMSRTSSTRSSRSRTAYATSITSPTTIPYSSSRTASATSITSPTTIPGITADQQKAVDLHNEARELVGCSPLTWDAGLANDAQVYAKTLASIDKLQHDVNRGNEGENLYYQYGSGSPPYAAATTWWLNEKQYYTGQAIPLASSNGKVFSDYGHYTQCVWKTTTKVGMAIAQSASGKTYVVARYSPAGNM